MTRNSSHGAVSCSQMLMCSCQLSNKYVYEYVQLLFTESCKMADSRELSETVVGVCRIIQWLLVQYEENNEPRILDSLVYQEDRLYHVLLAYSACSTLNNWGQSDFTSRPKLRTQQKQSCHFNSNTCHFGCSFSRVSHFAML